jgi:cytochrome c biogenesis protein CcmG, thiol:disulfide interchange protein DsbE
MPRLPSGARPIAALCVAMLGVVVLGSCAGSTGPDTPGTPASATGVLLPSTPAELPSFDVGTFRELLTQLHGTPVVVNVWASWCGPCKVEGPQLAQLAQRYQGTVQFLGVDIQDSRPAAQAFIERYGWIYPSVFDEQGAIRDGLGFIGQPVTVVYDRTGKQVHVFPGATSAEDLAQQIDRALQA